MQTNRNGWQRSNTRTTKTEILLFLNQDFFFSFFFFLFSLSVCLSCSLSDCPPCWATDQEVIYILKESPFLNLKISQILSQCPSKQVKAILKSLGWYCPCVLLLFFIIGSSHSKAKYWDPWCSRIVKKASFKSKIMTIYCLQVFGIGWYMDQALENDWEP
jgi:hypothetical protein